MLADILLRAFGENPIAYQRLEDKWIAISVDFVIFIVIPVYLLFLLVLPFLYIRWKKKQLTITRFIIALLISGALLAFGFFSLLAAFYILQGFAFCGIYGC